MIKERIKVEAKTPTVIRQVKPKPKSNSSVLLPLGLLGFAAFTIATLDDTPEEFKEVVKYISFEDNILTINNKQVLVKSIKNNLFIGSTFSIDSKEFILFTEDLFDYLPKVEQEYIKYLLNKNGLFFASKESLKEAGITLATVDEWLTISTSTESFSVTEFNRERINKIFKETFDIPFSVMDCEFTLEYTVPDVSKLKDSLVVEIKDNNIVVSSDSGYFPTFTTSRSCELPNQWALFYSINDLTEIREIILKKYLIKQGYLKFYTDYVALKPRSEVTPVEFYTSDSVVIETIIEQWQNSLWIDFIKQIGKDTLVSIIASGKQKPILVSPSMVNYDSVSKLLTLSDSTGITSFSFDPATNKLVYNHKHFIITDSTYADLVELWYSIASNNFANSLKVFDLHSFAHELGVVINKAKRDYQQAQEEISLKTITPSRSAPVPSYLETLKKDFDVFEDHETISIGRKHGYNHPSKNYGTFFTISSGSDSGSCYIKFHNRAPVYCSNKYAALSYIESILSKRDWLRHVYQDKELNYKVSELANTIVSFLYEKLSKPKITDKDLGFSKDFILKIEKTAKKITAGPVKFNPSAFGYSNHRNTLVCSINDINASSKSQFLSQIKIRINKWTVSEWVEVREKYGVDFIANKFYEAFEPDLPPEFDRELPSIEEQFKTEFIIDISNSYIKLGPKNYNSTYSYRSLDKEFSFAAMNIRAKSKSEFLAQINKNINSWSYEPWVEIRNKYGTKFIADQLYKAFESILPPNFDKEG